MASLLEHALANLAVAAVLAVLAGVVGLWGRRPAITHALWLLVLMKLITPPLFALEIPWPTASPVSEVTHAPARLDVVVEPPAPPIERDVDIVPKTDTVNVPPELPDVDIVMPEPEAPVVAPVEALPEISAPAVTPPAPMLWLEIISICWLAGSLSWLTLALWRLWRFHRFMRFSQAAPASVQVLARELADCLRVRCPQVCVMPGTVSPLLWTLGRSPRLLLPAGLLERLPHDQLATLLAHELAHWRRRDDRVRWLEFIVLALYWWCPLVWWAPRVKEQ